MVNITRFAHRGERWADRAGLGELNSVLYSRGSERINLLMHAATLVGARVALTMRRSTGVLLDFGCGTGRTLRLFAQRGWKVIGTEITEEMLRAAKRFGLPSGTIACLTDGVSIPVRGQSVDIIWVCGVLKYSLLDPASRSRGGSEPDAVLSGGSNGFIPVYRDIAREMYRVLKPGGAVVSVEMWVDAAPQVFIRDFEQAGFVTSDVRVLRRYSGRLEELCQWRDWHRLPPWLVLAAGRAIATFRYCLDDPQRLTGGLRDYLFVWSKPSHRNVSRAARSVWSRLSRES